MVSNTSLLSTHVTNFLLWSFLPPFLSSFVLKTYYTLLPSHRPTVSPQSTPPEVAFQNSRAQKHARNARIGLITLYLIYTLLAAYITQGSIVNMNYYSLLNLPRETVEEGGASVVKSHWRRLARVYHPDKVGKEGEDYFVLLRKGVEVLEDDKKRWAYERFGEEVAGWALKNATERDYVMRGLQGAAGFYVFATVSVAGIAFFRKEERANGFWRYYSLALTFVLELLLLLQSSPLPFFTFLIPRRLPFEQIAVLRQLFISFSMAMSQLTPLLYPVDPRSFKSSTTSEEDEDARWRREMELLGPALERLERAAMGAEMEVVGLMRMEMQPFFKDAQAQSPNGKAGVGEEGKQEREHSIFEGVKSHMETLFRDMSFKNNPKTSQIWTNAVLSHREREEAMRKKSREEGAVDKAATLDRLRETDLSPPSTEAGVANGNGNGIGKNGGSDLASKMDLHPGRLPSPPPEGVEQ